jgi:hypothetical protein
VAAVLALASDFGFSFQCKVGSSLVLRRPIEITALIRHVVPELPETLGKIVKCRYEQAPPVLLRKLDDVDDCFFLVGLRLDLSDLDSSKRDC